MKLSRTFVLAIVGWHGLQMAHAEPYACQFGSDSGREITEEDAIELKQSYGETAQNIIEDCSASTLFGEIISNLGLSNLLQQKSLIAAPSNRALQEFIDNNPESNLKETVLRHIAPVNTQVPFMHYPYSAHSEGNYLKLCGGGSMWFGVAICDNEYVEYPNGASLPRQRHFTELPTAIYSENGSGVVVIDSVFY